MTPHEIKAFSETLTYLARLVVDIRTDQKLLLRMLDAQATILVTLTSPPETRGRKKYPVPKRLEAQRNIIRSLRKEIRELYKKKAPKL